MANGEALAACTPSSTGTAFADTIACTSAGGANGNVSGNGGNDTITISSGTTSAVTGNDGDDTINVNDGTTASVAGGNNNDTINVNGGTITGSVAGDAGTDTFNLNGGSIAGSVNGGNGADTFNLNGTVVSGNLDGGNGDNSADEFFLTSGNAANVLGQGGDDEIYLQGATIGTTTTGIINAGDGNNIITITSGQVFNILGGVNTDTITISGSSSNVYGIANAFSGDDFLYLNGGTIVAVDGGSGNDFISLSGATINNYIVGRDGADTIKLNSGYVGGNVHGDNNDDTIELNGATVNGSIFGGADMDTFLLLSGTVNAGAQSGGGNDTITLGDSANPSAPGPTIKGAVDGSSEDDTIRMYSGSAGSVTGAAGNDNVFLYGGNVTSTGDSVLGGDGNDLIELNGATVAGAIQGEGGSDTINLNGGSASAVDGGAGIDFITQTGGSVLSIGVGTENDEIKLNGGNVTSTGNAVRGGDGNDLLELNGSTVAGAMLGDAGSDTINLKLGSAGAVNGGAGIDFITQTGGSVLSIAGGTENDEIKLNGGNVTATGNAVMGGDGNDLIELNGSTVAGAIVGEGGNDTINWTLGSLMSINGGNGSDNVAISASAFDGSQRLDGGDDTLPGDGFIDELTISGRTFSTSGSNLLNWEEIALSSGGLTLTDGALTVGDTTDDNTGLFLTGGAHLRSAGPLSLLGNLFVGAGSRLEQLAGDTHSISGRLANAGTVDLQDGGAGDVLTVGGNYVGGGQILLDLDASAALSDRMDVVGDVSGAATRIVVSEISGVEGSNAPINVVTVGGVTRAGDFVADSFTAGAYRYSLELEGQDWSFRPTITSGGSFYPTVGALLSGFTRETVGSYYRRNGHWSQARVGGGEQVFAASSVLAEPATSAQRDGSLWLRGIGTWAEGEGTLSGGGEAVNYDRDSRGLQGGVEVVISEAAGLLLTGGLFAQFGKISGSASDVASGNSTGSADTTAMGMGGALSLVSASGYGEVSAGLNDYGIDTVLAGGATGETDGQGYFVSVEGGRIVQVSSSVALIPQAQLSWIGTEIDGFQASDGMQVRYDAEHSAHGRIGLGFEADAGMFVGQPLALTGILNLRQRFGDPSLAFVSGQPLSLEQSSGSLEAGLGLSLGRSDSPLAFFSEGSYEAAIRGNGESGWTASAGVRMAF